MRVLIVVTHLLGAGHLTRAAALARAFADAGHETTLVSGGNPTRLADFERIRLIQLPPIHIRGTDFRALLDEAGEPVTAALMDQRRIVLLDALKVTRPDILITELFPFGRRALAEEFTALLDAAHRMTPRPLILCSIRDILVASSRKERIAETHERLHAFDAVLVHGDPQLIPLEASWPVNEQIAPLIRYTGYVDENVDPVPTATRHGVVVSGGSSPASLPLYRAALEAAREIADRPWRVLIGRGIAEDTFQLLKAQAPAHVTVERARPDFRTLLAQAEVSVSQAGYNTAVDLLRTGVRAVLVPFEAGQETEQRLRAERLESLGLAEIVPEDILSPQLLVLAIRKSLSRPFQAPPPLALDGARRSVAIAENLYHAAPALHRPIDWSPLDRALDRARDEDCPIAFWWRDDDAVADTPALQRLLHLARQHGASIALACIPAHAEPSLASCLSAEPHACALVHGWRHANHAPVPEKKAEFGAHRPLTAMTTEAAEALHRGRDVFGDKLLPVFVPPWNRMAPGLAAHLPQLGFTGLSTFGDRSEARPAKDLLQINAHIDPIDWHGTRSLLEPVAIVAALASAVERRVLRAADRAEPIGLLTHHLVHDEATWSFCEALLVYLYRRDIRFLSADALFCNGDRIGDPG